MQLNDKKRDIILRAGIGIGRIKDHLAQVASWKKRGISNENLLQWLEERKAEEIAEIERVNKDFEKYQAMLDRVSPKCSICGKRMDLGDVNDHPARMIDEPGKSMWACPDDCEYAVNQQSAKEILK